MRNKLGNLCMLLGAALILSALSLLIWNQREDQQAGAMVQEVLPKLVKYLGSPAHHLPDAAETPLPDPYAPVDPTMTQVDIDGYGYVGFLSVPGIGLELPVMAEWDYDRLKLAPCRYAGSTKTDDLVICGHSYKSHFGPIRSLDLGEQILFTDMDGLTWSYQVMAVEVLQPTAIEEMTAGEYDLTLFTCTYSTKARVAVRCDRVVEEEEEE